MYHRFGIFLELQSALGLVRVTCESHYSPAYKSPDEGSLRRSLFEHTGGSYPELITRGDIKLFLPPIGMCVCRLYLERGSLVTGGLTVYCFGDPAKMSDEKVRLALRVHDEVRVHHYV